MKIIELLNKSHNRESFNCGNEILNQFLTRTARQHIQKGISRTFVLVDTEKPQTIIGFFTLSICKVKAEKLPPQLAKKYPTTVSGVKLARLAVTQDWQGQRIGEILMIEAMKRALVIAENAGVIGLFVDAKDEKAHIYYQSYGFLSLVDVPLEMFLPLETIKQLF